MITQSAKLISSPHYHVWTDALHARALAQQTESEWDRGSYLRWCITSAWTAFEMVCEDALGKANLGMRFCFKVDEALSHSGFAPLEWGHGIWQRVAAVYKMRKSFVHVDITSDLSQLQIHDAEAAMATLRDAIAALYLHVNKPAPTWQNDDHDAGWRSSGSRSHANLTIWHAGAERDDPSRIEIQFVSKGCKRVAHVLPSGAEYLPVVMNLKQSLRCEASAIYVYVAGQRVYEEKISIRGF